jgi:L-threonylcarbamoyladenylate synthase
LRAAAAHSDELKPFSIMPDQPKQPGGMAGSPKARDSVGSGDERGNHGTAIDAAQIDHAAALLDAGELVAFPTETVYGLGGDAESPEAVARIYAAKGRPANHPVIVHLAPHGDPRYWVEQLPADAQRLIDAFWPGPLTLILKRAAHIPSAVSGGQDSVGLRCPSHPVAQALLDAFSARRGGHGGVAAPSANRFGHVSPTTAQHVRDEFGSAIHVLDGGASNVGIESTIVDLSRGFPALLRPGHVTPQDIAEVLGELPRLPDGSDATAPRASGTLKAHYAPRTPLALLPFDALEPLLAAARDAGERVALVARASRAGRWADADGVHFVAAPEDPHAYARDLYGLLRALDRANVARILIEQLPDTIEWIAVNDRLGRAAAAFEASASQ